MTASDTPARALATAALLEAIDEILHLTLETVPLDRTLKDLGADSVDEVEIVAHVRDRLGLRTALTSHSRSQPLRLLLDELAADGAEGHRPA